MEALNQDPKIQMMQIAHDLKSPLTALEIIAARLKTLPPDERQLIIQAVGRIQEIVVDVLKPTPVGSAPSSQKSWGLEDLRHLLEEKKLEFPNVIFQLEMKAIAPADNQVPAHEMNRVLSNLLNNACEANGGQGVVSIRVTSGYGISIEIEDEGPGVPIEIRGRLGQLGVSGKTANCELSRGFGLYSAFQFIERVGGHLLIEDRHARSGTVVRLNLAG